MFGKVGAANQQWGQMMAGYTSSPRPQTTLHFDDSAKSHCGPLPHNAAFKSLVTASTRGELAPQTGDIYTPQQVMQMSDHVFGNYAQGNPVLCSQINNLATDLQYRLEQSQKYGGHRVPMIPEGGYGATVKTQYMPAVHFMQTLTSLASARYPPS
jgi:hypothetical protein